jgi:long-subunit fatty acid transport protein
MKKILLGMGLACSTFAAAQTDVDALRYSQTTFGGSARALSMGGAFGALGGDLSSLSVNPAGIAIYRKTEFTFTPSLLFQNSSSSYLRRSQEASKVNFNFSNAGFVLTYNKDTDWKNLNFGFGYNRINNFHGRTNFSAVNNSSSLLDNYLERLNGGAGTNFNTILDDGSYAFDLRLAYQTGLIYSNPAPDTNHYTHDLLNAGEVQDRTSSTSGSMGEVFFTFGANYMDNLYLGATLSFNSIDYSEKSVYSESDPDGSIKTFKSFNLNQNLSTTGSGFNLKLGALYRATDWFRIGLAYHTPTFYNLSDSYSTSMDAYFDTTFNGKSFFTAESPEGSFNYQLVTPARSIGSLGFIILKKALLSLDYEYLNYGGARLSSSDYSFNNENDAVKNKYTSAANIRFGAEYRINSVFTLRGGYALYGTPYKSGIVSIDAKRTSYTGGFGIRGDYYYIDFAYVAESYEELFVPYTLSSKPVEGAVVKQDLSRYAVTFGVRF